MNTKKISLTTQIKKVIGNRILFCSIIFMLIIGGLTIYDLSISITQLKARVDETIKPIDDFVIDQAMIDNLETVKLKIESFNERNSTFKIEWVKLGGPTHKDISWDPPFSWVYDYQIGKIAGYQLGYFKVTGGFLSDKTLLYDLIIRLILLFIFTGSIISILYPLAKKIPEQLFINPINRFIDLVSNNPLQNEILPKSLPVELETLETKILGLLKTAMELERNKADIELGQLSARLVHDIRSPLLAMEMGIRLLSKKVPLDELTILINGIQSVRDTANNVLEKYRNPHNENHLTSPDSSQDDGNIVRPILLSTLTEFMISQKRHEWDSQPTKLMLTINPEAKISWVTVSPNEVKRILSNLLNNAYDAIHEKSGGIIQVILNKTGDKLYLHIKDNGVGIPTEKITDVLNGVSLKHTGKGLGLSVANQYMDNLGGNLKVNSTLGSGTEITLVFPLTKNISWFPEKISLINATNAIVLDDDFSMLAYWEQRLSEVGFQTKLFSNYDKAIQWVNDNNMQIKSTIFLADYELANRNKSGLVFLEKISSNNRYLITSHAEDFYCQKLAEEAGVWLIPKSLANEISLAY